MVKSLKENMRYKMLYADYTIFFQGRLLTVIMRLVTIRKTKLKYRMEYYQTFGIVYVKLMASDKSHLKESL